MKRLSISQVVESLLVAAASMWCISARADGTVEGTVTLPMPKPGSMTTARYQPKMKGPMAQPDPPMAVVYLDVPGGAATGANQVYRMGQKGFQFVPCLLVVPKGAKVEFPNDDEEYHNVLSYSKAKELDLGRYRKDEKAPVVVFDKTGLVELNCEIHEHMRGLILVLDSRHFVKTDSAGKYRLEHLPVGKFALKAWSDEKTTLSQPV